MKKSLLIALIGSIALSGQAQEFAIKAVEVNADQVILHYDLKDTAKNHTYTVFVYSSRDNFLAPLTKISGDASLEVKPGLNRKIIWNAKEELGATFDGDVELEIRGRLYIPFIRFEGFEDVQVRKRKVPFLVKWSGGTRQNILNFQLYQGERLVYTFPNAPNEFQYELELPTAVKPGSGYYFRISDTKNRDQVVITTLFDVKRKISLGVKAAGVAGLGAIAIWLAILNQPDDLLDPAPGPPE